MYVFCSSRVKLKIIQQVPWGGNRFSNPFCQGHPLYKNSSMNMFITASNSLCIRYQHLFIYFYGNTV